jgi:hypothetical protein
MMKDNTKKTLIIATITIIAAMVLAVVVMTTVNSKQGGASKHYDLNCLTQPIENPLKDCEEK